MAVLRLCATILATAVLVRGSSAQVFTDEAAFASQDRQQEPLRLPVPSRSEQARALRLVRELFATDYAKATTDAERLALADRLFRQASQTNDDPAGRFALLKVAINVATETGEARTVMKYVNTMEGLYRIDSLNLREGVLRRLGQVSRTKEQFSQLAYYLSTSVNQAVETDAYAAAERLNEMAIAAAKRADKSAAARKHESLQEVIAWLARQHAEVRRAQAVLDADPEDGEANVVVGRFLCFAKDEWQRGLEHLARGSHAQLQSIARNELKAPTAPIDQAALGGDWYDLVRDDHLDPREKTACLLRAVSWYRRALGNATGLTRMKIEKRLSEVEADPLMAQVVQNAGGPPFSGRTEEKKAGLLARYEGNRKTEEAVLAGLQWLARRQLRDGDWSLSGPYSDGAKGGYDNRTAATAMALLAFQGAGNTTESGPFKTNVGNGWNWLLQEQDKNGCFFHEGPMNHRFYTQGQATIAICELYGMTQDEKYREPAKRAVKYCVNAQGSQGGWRYEFQSDSDVSVTGWVVMALQSAKMAGLEVDEEVFRRVEDFLDKVAQHNGSRYPYRGTEQPTLAMTAEALLCRQYLGWPQDDPRLVAGVEWNTSPENLIDFNKGRNAYYWYYATQVAHHMEGEYWKRWNDVMRETLPRQQVRSGPERGSWDPAHPILDQWAPHGGRLYVTCFSIYMLEVYYRYPSPLEPVIR